MNDPYVLRNLYSIGTRLFCRASTRSYVSDRCRFFEIRFLFLFDATYRSVEHFEQPRVDDNRTYGNAVLAIEFVRLIPNHFGRVTSPMYENTVYALCSTSVQNSNKIMRTILSPFSFNNVHVSKRGIQLGVN